MLEIILAVEIGFHMSFNVDNALRIACLMLALVGYGAKAYYWIAKTKKEGL